jgi:tetratricopeptide (TPR) repeat protein
VKVSVHQRKARDYIQREDWGNALVELERLLEADRDNPTLQNQIGDVYLRKEDVARACEHFEAAIDLYAQVGLHNNAVALCKKVMRLRPGRFEMRYRLARLRLDQGFRSEAAAFFRDYLDHIPDDDDYAPKLEANCREMVELLAEEAPLGKILESSRVCSVTSRPTRSCASCRSALPIPVTKRRRAATPRSCARCASSSNAVVGAIRSRNRQPGCRSRIASLPPTPALAPAAADTPLVLERLSIRRSRR